MWRARVETTMAGIAAVLISVTFIWPTWIESLTGLEPDGGTGETQWWLALNLAVAALALSLMTRPDRRIALGRSSMAEAG